MSKVNDLLKKLKALAEQGEGGEATNAKKMLAELMQKHGITEDMISDDIKRDHIVKLSKEEKDFFVQVVASVVGKNFEWWTTNKKNAFILQVTSAEFMEIKSKFDFFYAAYQRDLKIFYNAFVQKNKLYRLPDPDEQPKDKELTEEDRKALWLAQNMERHQFKKTIDSPKLQES